MSAPINAYPSRGDREVIPMGLPGPVATMSTGVDTNHSSTVASISGDMGNRTQYNDDELGDPSQGPLDPGGDDPNLSGPHPTEPLLDPLSGPLSDWQENDDYRDFTYNTANVPESRLLAGYCYPTGYSDTESSLSGRVSGEDQRMAGASGAWGSDNSQPQGTWSDGQSSQGGISIDAVIRR